MTQILNGVALRPPQQPPQQPGQQPLQQPSQSAPANAEGSRDGMMSQIRRGVCLKKVPRGRSGSADQSVKAPAAEGALVTELKQQMRLRRQSIRGGDAYAGACDDDARW